MAKKRITLKEIVEEYAKRQPNGDLLNEQAKAIIVVRKLVKDDEEDVSFNITGGGDFRQNDAVIAIISFLELMDHNPKNPKRPEHFAIMRRMLEELVSAYNEMVEKLDKVIEKREKEEAVIKSKEEKHDA